MDTRQSGSGWQRGWAGALALLSFILALVALIPLQVPATNTANEGGYGLTVAVLLLAIVCAVGALAGNRRLLPAWVRWLSLILAGLGLLVSAYLLLVLIGTCGAGVLGGTCQP